MARTTTTKTTATKAKPIVETVKKENVNIPAEAETVTETSSQVIKEDTKSTKREYRPTDGIPCRSIITGELGMTGDKTGIPYRWLTRGDIVEVEYQDLVAAIRLNRKHIKEPFFIIVDDEFISQFPQIQKMYSDMFTIRDLKDVINLPVGEMRQVIVSMPHGAQESIKSIVSTMISNGTLDSIQKIKVLDEIFDTKLMLLTELLN